MKALITGIDGFVGRYLSEYLLTQGIAVYGTYLVENKNINLNKNVEFFKMDITNKEEVKQVLKATNPDYILHLAAQSSAAISWEKPQLTMEVNINGTLNLLETVRTLEHEPRILLIGSSEEYGYVKPEDIPVNEEQTLKPGNPYAISKIAQSMIGELYVKAYNMDIIMIRAFNHIGPGQSPTFVVSDFAKRIAEMEKGKIAPILKVGNLEAERDFTDVRDIVRAYYELLLHGETGEIYNVGTGEKYKIKEILDNLILISDVNVKIENDPKRMRPSDVPIIKCDNTKLKKITKWETKYTLEDTLRDVLDYWKSNI